MVLFLGTLFSHFLLIFYVKRIKWRVYVHTHKGKLLLLHIKEPENQKKNCPPTQEITLITPSPISSSRAFFFSSFTLNIFSNILFPLFLNKEKKRKRRPLSLLLLLLLLL